MHYKKYTFKNGLRVILVPVKDMTTATVIVVVGTGSRYEDVHENGMAHFLEHMFFKGTKKRGKAQDIARELDALGAAYNAYTGKERTGYYAKVAADKILSAMDVVHDLFLHSTLAAAEIKKESGAILQEINMYQDMPSRTVYDVFEGLMYGADHPLGRTILGPKKNITSFSRKAFLAYKERCYNARNTVVCIAGNFPQGKALAKIRKDFAHLNAGTHLSYEPFCGVQDAPACAIKNKKTDQTHLILGVRTIGFAHKDRYILYVLANILGGGMSSRLFTEIRERRGLAYNIGASVDFFEETGTFMVHAGVEHANLTKTLTLIIAQMKKIATKGVTTEEITRAKAGFAGRTSFGYESSDDIAAHFAEQEAIKGKITLPQESLAKIEKVSRADIRRMAQKIFVNEVLNLAIIGPHEKRKKEIQALLHF